MKVSVMPTVGDRVQLVEMPADPDPIEKGAVGTVFRVTTDQVGVAWDNGRDLNLLPDMDRWRIVDTESSASRQHFIDTGEYIEAGLTCPQCGSRDVKDVSQYEGIVTIDCESGHRTDITDWG